MSLGSIEDVPMVCDMCGSTFRVGDCECKDAYDHGGPYDGDIGCPVPDCGGTMKEVAGARQKIEREK